MNDSLDSDLVSLSLLERLEMLSETAASAAAHAERATATVRSGEATPRAVAGELTMALDALAQASMELGDARRQLTELN